MRTVRRSPTTSRGYNGGPFFSSGGAKIVYRVYHPKTEGQIREYEALLKEDLTRPSRMEIFVMDANRSNQRQTPVTARPTVFPSCIRTATR